jgi:opacity protein-like surface antigen
MSTSTAPPYDDILKAQNLLDATNKSDYPEGYEAYDEQKHAVKYGGQEGFVKHFLREYMVKKFQGQPGAAQAHVDYMMSLKTYNDHLEAAKPQAPTKLTRNVTHKSESLSAATISKTLHHTHQADMGIKIGNYPAGTDIDVRFDVVPTNGSGMTFDHSGNNYTITSYNITDKDRKKVTIQLDKAINLSANTIVNITK